MLLFHRPDDFEALTILKLGPPLGECYFEHPSSIPSSQSLLTQPVHNQTSKTHLEQSQNASSVPQTHPPSPHRTEKERNRRRANITNSRERRFSPGSKRKKKQVRENPKTKTRRPGPHENKNNPTSFPCEEKNIPVESAHHNNSRLRIHFFSADWGGGCWEF